MEALECVHANLMDGRTAQELEEHITGVPSLFGRAKTNQTIRQNLFVYASFLPLCIVHLDTKFSEYTSRPHLLGHQRNLLPFCFPSSVCNVSHTNQWLHLADPISVVNDLGSLPHATSHPHRSIDVIVPHIASIHVDVQAELIQRGINSVGFDGIIQVPQDLWGSGPPSIGLDLDITWCLVGGL